MKPFLSVIIPAYNEASRLPLTLIDIDKHLSRQDFSFEVLVVNDGSQDNTAEVVKKLEPLLRNLKLIDNPQNRGKGYAVRQGMLAAKGSWRLFMDADNSTSIAEFLKMTPYFKEGYDVVIGSRAVRGSKLQPSQPFFRQLLGKIGNLFIQLMILRGIWDTQCGFKCFSEEAAEKVFSRAKMDSWSFDIETLALARKLGYRIKEMPVTWSDNPSTNVKPGAYFEVLRDTIKIWWRLR